MLKLCSSITRVASQSSTCPLLYIIIYSRLLVILFVFLRHKIFVALSVFVINRSEFPCRTIQILNDHVDEVWFCRFSPNGKRLATGSKDGKLIIWDIDQVSFESAFIQTHDRHLIVFFKVCSTSCCGE